MITKLLVANRGEIAVRIVRAAAELGIRTVAVYPHEERHARHRFAADEAYEITGSGGPVSAYLDIEALVAVATASGCDAVHPGYGFLSENPRFARACERARVAFVGPSPDVLETAGDKVAAREAAFAAGLPVLRAGEAFSDPADAEEAGLSMGVPLFVKALAGGGGRGMRLVEREADLRGAIDAAMREADAAFHDGRVFLEEAMMRPRHVEVQVLGDATGDVVHLYERDCSLQRRHQKVVEMAPAPGLAADVRDRLCADAVAFARALRYRGAGTVEFLVGADGRHVFIEMNPRVQVEHTVTEEVTDIDIVKAQLAIAGGAALADLGITQGLVRLRGAALQCRLTTEVPSAGFAPDTGRISACRLPGGPGVRIDEAALAVGTEISPHFDSLLAKITCRGRDIGDAVGRARRALDELRVEGVGTNRRFLSAVLAAPELVAGGVTTAFLADHADLLETSDDVDAGAGLARWVVETTATRPHGEAPARIRPEDLLPPLRRQSAPLGSRHLLRLVGADEFARRLRSQRAVAVTDTTFRDAHQSLLATRLRSFDMLAVAPHMARTLPSLWSIEAWGGATFDVALRFLHEDPWQRLERLRQAVPNVCLQMLLRGRNTVSYEPSSDAVCAAFVAEAERTGIDVFRVFDALNDVEAMRPAIDAVLEAGAVCEGTLCYTGDLSSPGENLYTLDYYLRLAEQLVQAGAHVLAVKDMAGLLRAPAAATLVSALRDRFEQPVHLHTHDTAGGQLATYTAAIAAGVDAVDVAAAPLSGTTSQPSFSALVAALAGTRRDPGFDLAALNALEPYWEAVRSLYRPFEMGLRAPTGRVYEHEIPGGQLSNLRQQATALGLGERFEDVMRLYAAADRLLGRIVKVTPTSKVVGDLALALASSGVSPEAFAEDPSRLDLPAGVLCFLRGDLGEPPAGWPEPLRTRALTGRTMPVPPIEHADADALARPGAARRSALNRMLFPAEAGQYEERRQQYGDLSVLPTDLFFYGLDPGSEREVVLADGRRVAIAIDAVAGDEGGPTVVCRVDGTLHVVPVGATRAAAVAEVEKADPAVVGHIAAPFTGVVTVRCTVGDVVGPGEVVATIEAMKMESSITAPVGGRVKRVAVDGVSSVTAGDLVVVVDPVHSGA